MVSDHSYLIDFPTDLAEIRSRIAAINPKKYARSRNYIDGSVSYLSPYISRGVISTKQIYKSLLDKGYTFSSIEKYIQELAWRDYWQQVWIAKGNTIDNDLKIEQKPIANYEVSTAVIAGKTGIQAIDFAIKNFYDTGYLHNHLRMYIASINCNIANNHWKKPAKWMYFHLIDADWASNALSWQWVAGANSNKKYYANQENINRYCHTKQKNTFLDVAYEDFETLEIPDILKGNSDFKLETLLPKSDITHVNSTLTTYIYNFYNLDPNWKKEEKANRILLLEPSIFEKYPISTKTMDFLLSLSKNIEHIQIYVGEFDDLVKEYSLQKINFKEHPLNKHYKGSVTERDWMFDVKGYYPSFFSYWKKCKKEIKKLSINDGIE
ncbi:deoxyribodipyrimidine photolyase [Cellulophaga sp. HaHaR_3_176]|uniref:FAD-binding domain-containing protein n=1 Tax=Cellulophaga sp. HaHaR_3_176 TaxID=1942464 RepID=UPI001C1F3CD9|nr:FAD-binding domain-containing protein [Cellulophaga sp. HaHaR_3_176]QWX84958.1 deoxyribodipyrimidine photolyase [Cellulophaga sp. HaHaR_3_176]